tara:strand:+ start:1058 stop:2455 length:1398 start_codon:yes stop_codon:yes gene_type:complete
MAFTLILLPNVSAQAQTAAYVVEDVPLDKSASNAVEAKDLAIVEGQREAFVKLANRLLIDAPDEKISEMSDLEISSLINDFEINHEKFSSTRYQARMTVRFNEGAVKRKLSSYGTVQLAQENKDNLLILPYLNMGGRSTLWSEDNRWLQAWKASSSRTGLVPLTIPLGDTNDMALVDETMILTSGKEEIRYLLEKYNAEDVLIPVAAIKDQGVQVTIYSYIGTDLTALKTLRVDLMDSTDMDILLSGAVDEVKKYIDEDWKSRQKFSSVVQDNRAGLRIYFDSMRDWIETQRKIRALPEVQTMTVQGLKRDFASVEAILAVDTDGLSRALSRIGYAMTLVEPAGGYGVDMTPAVYEVREATGASYQGDYNPYLSPSRSQAYYGDDDQNSGVVYDTTRTVETTTTITQPVAEPQIQPQQPVVIPPQQRLPNQPSLSGNNAGGSYEYRYRPQENYNNKNWDNTYDNP